jgi:hypothetical protein
MNKIDTFLKIFKETINWFDSISLSKKLYVLITIMAFGLYKIITYYDGEIKHRDSVHNARIDTISNELERCNDYSKNQSERLIKILQNSLKETESLRIESERLKLDMEKLKHNSK